MANKYEKGKIYKLVSPNSDNIYIGSTIDTLSRRFGKHKANANANKKGKTVTYMFVYGDCRIILIELFPCKSKDELRSREQYHMDLHKEKIVNGVRAKLSREEMLKDQKESYYRHRDEHIIRKIEYNKKHREELIIKKREYNKEHREELIIKKREYNK